MEKKQMMLFGFLLFLPFPGEKAEAYDFYSYIPFLYKVPEGSVGVFRNRNQFYDDVYPAGVYPVWPSDEGFVISIMPEKVAVPDISCITAEGVKITFPRITVHYQVHEQDVLALVKGYGLDFVKPVIKDPVKQGVTHLCGAMAAEAVYGEEFAMLKEYLGDYLAGEQKDKNSGISISDLDIDFPRVPDVIIESHAGHNPDHQPQPPTTCEQPYDIFYTLEDEQEAASCLCGSGDQPDEPYLEPVPEGDAAESNGSVAGNGLTSEPSLTEEANTGDSGQAGDEVPQKEQSVQWAVDPFIDRFDVDVDVDIEDAEPSENRLDSGSEPVEEVHVNAVPVNSETEINRNIPPEWGDAVPGQERSKETLNQQRQDLQGLWKNNNSRLYLVW